MIFRPNYAQNYKRQNKFLLRSSVSNYVRCSNVILAFEKGPYTNTFTKEKESAILQPCYTSKFH